MSDDVKIPQRVSQTYRELGAEEPPRALDEAILAAARRGRQRWYAPLATAAVLVLAVAVTLNMQRDQPGVESPAPQVAPRAAVTETAKVAEKSVAAAEVKAPTRKPAERLAPNAPVPSATPTAREPQPFAANQAAGSAAGRADDSRRAESSVTGALARQMEERTSRDAEAASRAPRLGAFQAQKEASAEASSPERELDRIALLRVQGRHDEADRALADFRKRYPDYRIPDAMRERVERR